MYWRYAQNIWPYMVQYLLRVLKFHCHGNRYTDKTCQKRDKDLHWVPARSTADKLSKNTL